MINNQSPGDQLKAQKQFEVNRKLQLNPSNQTNKCFHVRRNFLFMGNATSLVQSVSAGQVQTFKSASEAQT